jgi:PAS domain S-box-containing protein
MRSIRTRLVLLSAGLILMVTAVLTVVIAVNASRVLHSTLENALSQQIRQGSDLFLNFLKWQSMNLEVWDSQPVVKVFFKSPALAVLTRSGLEVYLNRACDQAPWIADILLVDHDTVLYDHAFPGALSSRQSGQGEVFWAQLFKGRPFLMNLGRLHPDQDRWVLVLSRQVSEEGKPEPGRFIALFLDLAQVNKALFSDLAIGHKGFMTFAGLLPDDRMMLPDTNARTDVQREFFTDAAAWNRPRDIPEAQGMILLKTTTLPGFPIRLIGVASRRDFQQPVRVLIMNSLLIGLFILAVGILGAVVFSNRLTAPLTRLTAIIKGITAGEKGKDASLESSDLLERTDELRVLAGAFSTMLADIRRHTAELEEKVALRTADLQQTNTRMTAEIQERKKAERAIRESEERLSTILKTTNQGFWLVDNDTNTIDVNDAMCAILNRKKEEIIGRKIYEFMDEENIEKVRRQERVRSERKRSLYEVSLMRSDGKRVPCLVNASPLFDGGGNKIGSFGMFTEITERKRMEEDLKRNVEELELFNKLAIGREIKMIQLKQEINELLGQLGQAEKYEIVE